MSPNTTMIYPLETGICVTKHNSDLATRNRDICSQAQLWSTHVSCVCGHLHLAVMSESELFWGHLSLSLAMMSESELVLTPSTVSESKLYQPQLTLIYPLEKGLYVTKHNSDLATRNMDICCEKQLWFSHNCAWRQISLFLVGRSKLCLGTYIPVSGG
jgi:hypothetical protein